MTDTRKVKPRRGISARAPNLTGIVLLAAVPLLSPETAFATSCPFSTIGPNGGTDDLGSYCTAINPTYSSTAFLAAASHLYLYNARVASTGDLTVAGLTDGAVSVASGGRLTVSSGQFRLYSGALSNQGVLTNSASLINGDSQSSPQNFTNTGTFDNAGTFINGWAQNNSGSQTSWSFTNSGTLNNTGQIRNGALINNSGTLVNGGLIELADIHTATGSRNGQGMADLNNTGTLVNNGRIRVMGASDIYGSGSITNNGQLDVTSVSQLYRNSDGTYSGWVLQPTVAFGRSANLAGGTLTGGIWNVTSASAYVGDNPNPTWEDATLSLGAAPITILAAGTSVSLNGQRAYFDQLKSLTRNSGQLSLFDRPWTFASGFVNEGRLDVTLRKTAALIFGGTRTVYGWTVEGALTFSDTFDNSGTAYISTASLSSKTPPAGAAIRNSGTLTLDAVYASVGIENSGSLTIGRDTQITGVITNSGTVINSSRGSAYTWNGTSPEYAAWVAGNSAGGSVSNSGAIGLGVNSGVVSNTGSLILRNAVNDGQILQQGGIAIVEARSTLTGTGVYLQTGGTTVIDGSMSQEFTLSGGTLKGSGTLNGNLLATGGTIAPGNSPGTLTIAGDANLSGAILDLEIGGLGAGAHDVLAVNGNLGLEGAGIIFHFVNGYAPKAGDALSLFLFVSSGSITGLERATFSVLGLAEGFQYDLGPDGTLTALSDGMASSPVPLPAGFWLLLSGLGGLAIPRMRNGRLAAAG